MVALTRAPCSGLSAGRPTVRWDGPHRSQPQIRRHRRAEQRLEMVEARNRDQAYGSGSLERVPENCRGAIVRFERPVNRWRAAGKNYGDLSVQIQALQIIDAQSGNHQSMAGEDSRRIDRCAPTRAFWFLL